MAMAFGLGLALFSLLSIKLTLIVFACGLLSAITGLALVHLNGDTTDAVVLSMPSLLGLLSLTGRLVLPYQVVTYVQQLLSWLNVVVTALADAVFLLVRYVCTGPAGPACLALVAMAGALVAIWTRFLVGRLATQRVNQ
jgi:hypothetical protein